MKPSTSVLDIASKIFRSFFMMALLLIGGGASAQVGVHQKPSEFLKEKLGVVPATKAITLTAAQQAQVRALLGKDYKTKAIRYWTRNGKTAFILEEIGKTEFITTGLVVKGGKIDSVKVLVYRETHGWEVARDAFTKQFKGATLKSKGRISKVPRNIAGATLSVRALTNLARLALYLDSQK